MRLYPFTLLGLLGSLVLGPVAAASSESVSAIDLAPVGAAFCLEVPEFEKSWAALESGSMLGRIKSSPAFAPLFDNDTVRRWNMIEDRVAKRLGDSFSARARDLCARSLVVAISFPSSGVTEGVVIAEGKDDSAAQLFITNWNHMEVETVTTFHAYNGQQYQRRLKPGAPSQTLYLATLGRLFSISDHESQIRNVIDRYVEHLNAVDSESSVSPQPGRDPFLYQRRRFERDGNLYMHLNARPWDREIEDSAGPGNGTSEVFSYWKQFSSLCCSLSIDRGILCDVAVELEPSAWSKSDSPIPTSANWQKDIPAGSLIAFGGRFELASFIRLLDILASREERTEVERMRRSVQSLFSGHDILGSVVPALTRNVSGHIKINREASQTRLDGLIRCQVDTKADPSLVADIWDGLGSLLKLYAASLSARQEKIVFVRSEQTDKVKLRWLSEPVAFPIALGLQQQTFVFAGSLESVRQLLDETSKPGHSLQLPEQFQLHLQNAHQFCWIDAVQARRYLDPESPETLGLLNSTSAESSGLLGKRFTQFRGLTNLFDSLFYASRRENDHLRVVFGGGFN